MHSATARCRRIFPAGSLVLAALAFFAAAPAAAADSPIALHPDNPHYFLFRGRPTVLITSAEHYGAVLNLDFDYVRYLEKLQRHGLNQTRTFSGTYREVPGSVRIANNTLAPKPNRYVCPWARSKTPGYHDGGNKFDLSKWDEAYFARLKDFLAQASKRGVVVELVLFCPTYNKGMWHASPMNARNNVSGVGDVNHRQPHTLKNGGLLKFQTALVEKIVRECNAFDNLYYEMCNEPYYGGVTLAWQERIVRTIVETEKGLPRKHLIAQNIANGSKKVTNPNPAVSIFNFHYCSPPDAVAMNWHLNRPIAYDETGYFPKGGDEGLRHRLENDFRGRGWNLILAGGAVFSHLNSSFTPDDEDASADDGPKSLPKTLGILKRFIDSFDFVRMAPDNACIKGGVPKKATARALVEKGKQYAVFVRGGGQANLVLDLPKGSYRAEWVNTLTGKVDKRESFQHAGGEKTLASPDYKGETALRILRK